MERKFMRSPEQWVVVFANLSANDTLRVQQALVLIMIVNRVDWHWKYNSPTTSPPWSNFQKLPLLASWLLKTASFRHENNKMFENETTWKNYFLRGLVKSLQSTLERGDYIFSCLIFRWSSGAQRWAPIHSICSEQTLNLNVRCARQAFLINK